MPRELDTSRLQQFHPRQRREVTGKPVNSAASEPNPDQWPSRETPKEGQFTIRAPLATIARFRRMCKDDRRTYADMLWILMDGFEKEA